MPTFLLTLAHHSAQRSASHRWQPLLLTPFLLAACQTTPHPPETYDLSGTVGGDWGAAPKLRLALVGASFPQVLTNQSNLEQNAVRQSSGHWSYGVNLPFAPSAAGIYQVIAFNDTNGNASYDVGEQLARNRQYLVFSLVASEFHGFQGSGMNIPAMQVQQGWNLYDTAQPLGVNNPRPAKKVTHYNLSL